MASNSVIYGHFEWKSQKNAIPQKVVLSYFTLSGSTLQLIWPSILCIKSALFRPLSHSHKQFSGKKYGYFLKLQSLGHGKNGFLA